MKEIKFRGKTQRGEWIYGNFIDWGNHEQTYIFPLLDNATSLNLGESIMAMAKWVDIKTVGQFTGLYDKNGKEIYEGDIVKVRYSIGFVEFGRIGWDSGTGLTGFYFVSNDFLEDADFYSLEYENAEDTGKTFHEADRLIDLRETEVIGNIYDNNFEDFT